MLFVDRTCRYAALQSTCSLVVRNDRRLSRRRDAEIQQKTYTQLCDSHLTSHGPLVQAHAHWWSGTIGGCLGEGML